MSQEIIAALLVACSASGREPGGDPMDKCSMVRRPTSATGNLPQLAGALALEIEIAGVNGVHRAAAQEPA